MQELSYVIEITIIVFLWCVSGLLLAGFIYGPFFQFGKPDIRWRCILTGFLGPIITLAVIVQLYAEDWGQNPKKLYWKSVF